MIRLYFVYEPDENTGVIVAAESNTKAKTHGSVEMSCDYIDLRARLVNSGDTYFDDMDSRDTGFHVTGKGTVQYEKEKALEWDEFRDYLMSLGRCELFDDRENLDHETKDVIFEGEAK